MCMMMITSGTFMNFFVSIPHRAHTIDIEKEIEWFNSIAINYFTIPCVGVRVGVGMYG